jgi:hypothetical protein
MITLATISASGSATRANEDAFFVHQDLWRVTLGVLDGVTQMITSPVLDAISTYHGRQLTPGGYAAAEGRTRLTHALSLGLGMPLRTALKAANAHIRRRVSAVLSGQPNAASLEDAALLAAFQHADPRLGVLGGDPRAVRVLLPAAVVTVARLDLATMQLECAHLGDTALLHFPAAGPPVAVTHQPQQGAPDPTYVALRALPLDASYFPSDYAHMAPQALVQDMTGRFYHNYQASDGTIEPSIGVGVLDGLPAMEAFIREYHVSIAPGDRVIVCSDGFLWPNEPFTEATLARMGASIAANGLAGWLAEVHAEQTRIAANDPLPRLKVHDDATAIELHVRL